MLNKKQFLCVVLFGTVFVYHNLLGRRLILNFVVFLIRRKNVLKGCTFAGSNMNLSKGLWNSSLILKMGSI